MTELVATELTQHIVVPYPLFPRRRESRPASAWIPGLASYRQLARNDAHILRHSYGSIHMRPLKKDGE
jgi:hypothetical protein